MQFYVFGANNFTFESLNLKETAVIDNCDIF